MTDDFAWLDATAQAALVRKGEATPAELVEAAIARVEALDGRLNAVIHERFDRARAEAAGQLPDGPLVGAPVVLKDHDGGMGGEPYHHGMAALKAAGHIAPHDDTSVARLRQAGAVVIGRTNAPELGLLPTTEPAAYGPTGNPWDPGRSPGGSSGGSAAAVASGMVALGTAGDGGGSIRIPASECGLFGMKPSRGRVPLGPDLGEAWGGMVVRGVVTRTVRDSALALDVMGGPSTGDPYAAAGPRGPYTEVLAEPPPSLRIGWTAATPSTDPDVHPDCAAAVESAVGLLAEMGHRVEETHPAALEDPRLAAEFFPAYAVWTARDVDAMGAAIGRSLTADDVEPGTWALTEMGRAVSGPQYLAAMEFCHEWSRRVLRWWDDDGFDVLVTPTITQPPPPLGSFEQPADNPLQGALFAATLVPFTVPFNVTGQPAMSVPLHWGEGDLPVGVQMVGAAGREDLLFRLAARLEEARPWSHRRPPVSAGG